MNITKFIFCWETDDWFSENDRIVRLLVESGSEVNAKSNSGDTALHFAANYYSTEGTRFKCSSLEFTRIFYDNSKYVWWLIFFAGLKDIVKYLIEKGANINATNENHCTALHLAAARSEF